MQQEQNDIRDRVSEWVSVYHVENVGRETRFAFELHLQT